MSMYYSSEELQTLATAAANVPGFDRLFFLAAWRYACYERARVDANKYLDEHKSGRPTKERERLQVKCSRKFGEAWALIDALRMLAEPFGTIHTGTIHDEILEMLDNPANVSFKTTKSLYELSHSRN